MELLKQKEKFEKLLENLPFGIFEKDKNGYFTYVNSVGAKYIGKEKSVIVGKRSIEIFDYQPDLGKAFEDGDKSLRNSDTGFEVNENIKYIDNKPYYYLTGKVLIDKDNPIESNIIGYSIDITERRLAEKEVLKQKETFENVLNSLFIPIIQKDKNGIIKFVNNRFMDIIKLEKSELIGKTDFDILHKDEAERIRELDTKIRENNNKVQLIEEIIINKKGESFNLLFGGDLIDKTNVDSDIINYTIDITDRKKDELE
ncbi:MAG: PAS domain-containing protein [Candidatus Sericytochromatia bacterium]